MREMLTTIAAELQDPRLGLATCPYQRAVPGHSFWNTLESDRAESAGARNT